MKVGYLMTFLRDAFMKINPEDLLINEVSGGYRHILIFPLLEIACDSIVYVS